MRTFTRSCPIQVVGDDFFVTSAEKVEAPTAPVTPYFKPNQVGTLTETQACWDAARTLGYKAIVSARSGETEDVDRASRRRMGRAAAESGQLLALGAHGEMERGAAHRGVARAKALPFPARKLFK